MGKGGSAPPPPTAAPTSPQASFLETGGTTLAFNSVVHVDSCFSVKGWSHIWVFIAGARTMRLERTGQARAAQVWGLGDTTHARFVVKDGFRRRACGRGASARARTSKPSHTPPASFASVLADNGAMTRTSAHLHS